MHTMGSPLLPLFPWEGWDTTLLWINVTPLTLCVQRPSEHRHAASVFHQRHMGVVLVPNAERLGLLATGTSPSPCTSV